MQEILISDWVDQEYSNNPQKLVHIMYQLGYEVDVVNN